MYLRSQRSAVARRLAEDAAAQANGQVVWDHMGTHGWHLMANFPAGTVRGSSIPSRVIPPKFGSWVPNHRLRNTGGSRGYVIVPRRVGPIGHTRPAQETMHQPLCQLVLDLAGQILFEVLGLWAQYD